MVSTLQAWKLCRAKPETGWTTVKNGGKLTMKTHRHRNEVNIIVYLKYEYLRQLFFFLFSLWVFCCPEDEHTAPVCLMFCLRRKRMCAIRQPSFPIGRENLKGQGTNTGGSL